MNHREYKPGMEIEVKGFICHPGYANPTFCEYEMAVHGYTTICPYTLKFTVPEGFNSVQAELASIDKAMGQEADAYHAKMSNFKDRKAELLQIGHTPGQQEVVEADAEQKFVNVEDIPF